MFERRHEPLAPRSVFLARAFKGFLLAAAIIAGSLLVGVLGYHDLAGLGWIDALLNASMILGGMGPVDPLTSDAAKLFASFYALYAGMVFVVAAGILVGPTLHRAFHHFHLGSNPGELEDER
jgi:hypothetical protein